MQSISLHIEYLLRSHECVILPGIGAFLRSYKAASMTDAGEVSAPALQVCFNSSIVASDGLLCHSVARREKISFEQATVLISKVVDEYRATLETTGELSVGRLGRLVMDDEQNVSFKPYAKRYANIWTSFKPMAAIDDTPQQHAVSTSADKNTDSDYYIIRISRKAIHYAAVAAICLLTAATILLPSASRNGEQTAPVEKQYASILPGVEKLSAKPEKSNEIIVQPNAVPEETAAESQAEPEVALEELSYYLIVATFSDEADCQKFISQQDDKDKLNIVNSGKVSRVYSAASNDRQELLDLLNSSAHKAQHPQAWIWTNPANQI